MLETQRARCHWPITAAMRQPFYVVLDGNPKRSYEALTRCRRPKSAAQRYICRVAFSCQVQCCEREVRLGTIGSIMPARTAHAEPAHPVQESMLCKSLTQEKAY